MRHLFLDWLERRGLTARLSQEQQEQLLVYVLLLDRWNQQINLTGSSLQANPDIAFDRLILEPVEFQFRFQPTPGPTVDIGSGSGSPALPYLICSPKTQITLIEARQKKAVFLKEASRAIGLPVNVERCRFEDFAVRAPGSFDVAMTRAVRVDEGLLGAIDKVLTPQGRFYYFTSIAQDSSNQTTKRFVSAATSLTEPTGFQIRTFQRP